MKRSWAKIGQTPVLDADGGHRDKVSVIASISVSPTNQRLGLYFATEPDGVQTFSLASEVVRFPNERWYDVSPDGQRFYGVQYGVPAPPPPPVTHLNLILNWFEEVRAKVPR